MGLTPEERARDYERASIQSKAEMDVMRREANRQMKGLLKWTGIGCLAPVLLFVVLGIMFG